MALTAPRPSSRKRGTRFERLTRDQIRNALDIANDQELANLWRRSLRQMAGSITVHAAIGDEIERRHKTLATAA